MKRFTLFLALIVGLLTSASTAMAQTVNMDSYITLTVTNGAAIKLDFKAAAAATPVRIVSGSNTQDITVGTDCKGTASYTAGSTTMTVYGDIIGFDCSGNGANLTDLDLSHNTQLIGLSCFSNNLSSLDVSRCTQLDELYCFNNTLRSLDVSSNTQLTTLECSNNTLTALNVSGCTQLTGLLCHNNTLNSLDVSRNTQLTGLWCHNNTLNSLDVSGCTQLTKLHCYNNKLNSLDVSGCTQLTELYCSSNTLRSLDVSHNTQLEWLVCHGNKFSAQALDDIYCALPDRTSEYRGVIKPVFNSSSSYNDTVLATNAQNAISKNWYVQYADNTDIPATTGKHKCSATDIAEASAEQALTLYPNPVADVLYLSATARTIRIYNVYGTEVAHASDTDRIDVSHLPAGVYTVKADGTVAKMVKR